MAYSEVGGALLDIHTDALLIDLGDVGLYGVPLQTLAPVTSGRDHAARMFRRYQDSLNPGRFQDVEGPWQLTRTRPSHALTFWIDGVQYLIQLRPLLAVIKGEIRQTPVSRPVMAAAQLDDAHSRQASLEVW